MAKFVLEAIAVCLREHFCSAATTTTKNREELRALLWLDKGVIGKKTLLNFREIPPGKLEDDKRSIDIPADIQVAGCHSMSLVVTHRSNLDNNEPVNDDDTAILTWWLNVDDEGQALLGDCPTLGGGS